MLNKPGLEAMREDQRLADFICALRGMQRGDVRWDGKLEGLAATQTSWAKPPGAEKRVELAG